MEIITNATNKVNKLGSSIQRNLFEVVEQEEVVSKEKAYYDACVAAGVLWDYAETETEKEALAAAIQALETLGKHLFGEQTTI